MIGVLSLETEPDMLGIALVILDVLKVESVPVATVTCYH